MVLGKNVKKNWLFLPTHKTRPKIMGDFFLCCPKCFEKLDGFQDESSFGEVFFEASFFAKHRGEARTGI